MSNPEATSKPKATSRPGSRGLDLAEFSRQVKVTGNLILRSAMGILEAHMAQRNVTRLASSSNRGSGTLLEATSEKRPAPEGGPHKRKSRKNNSAGQPSGSSGTTIKSSSTANASEDSPNGRARARKVKKNHSRPEKATGRPQTAGSAVQTTPGTYLYSEVLAADPVARGGARRKQPLRTARSQTSRDGKTLRLRGSDYLIADHARVETYHRICERHNACLTRLAKARHKAKLTAVELEEANGRITEYLVGDSKLRKTLLVAYRQFSSAKVRMLSIERELIEERAILLREDDEGVRPTRAESVSSDGSISSVTKGLRDICFRTPGIEAQPATETILEGVGFADPRCPGFPRPSTSAAADAIFLEDDGASQSILDRSHHSTDSSEIDVEADQPTISSWADHVEMEKKASS